MENDGGKMFDQFYLIGFTYVMFDHWVPLSDPVRRSELKRSSKAYHPPFPNIGGFGVLKGSSEP
jgi:hypothetical protein